MNVNVNIKQGNGENNGCVYVTIGDWVVYLDNSTGEQIVETINQNETENVWTTQKLKK